MTTYTAVCEGNEFARGSDLVRAMDRVAELRERNPATWLRDDSTGEPVLVLSAEARSLFAQLLKLNA